MVSKVDGLTKSVLHKTIIPNLENFMYTIKIDGMRSFYIYDNQKNTYIIQASK